jgi:hypothetical protein
MDKEARRRKLYEAMLKQSMKSDGGTQMVSGRAVPYSPMTGISKLVQAYMGGKGIRESEAREEETQAEASRQQQAAQERIMGTMMGKEQVGGPLRDITEYQEFEPAVQADPQKAAIMAATDPWATPAMGKVATAMMKAKGEATVSPYYRFLPTAEGYKIGNTRTGVISSPEEAAIRSADDPELQRVLAEGKETGKLGAQIELKPELVEAEALAEREAEKIIDQPKIESGLAAGEAKADLLNDTIDQALEQTGPWTAGFLGSMTSFVPGTPAHDLGKTLDTVRANIGFDKLQEMRANSPTGGALGQVSEMENKLLQSVWNSVEQSQSEEQLKENLEKVRTQVKESWDRVKEAYKKDYGKEYEGVTPKAAEVEEATGGVVFEGDKEQRYQEWKARQSQ